MAKKEKRKKVKVEKDFDQLKKEVEQKGKEIEQLKKTVEEMRTQIQGREETGEFTGLGKIFDDVSQLLDVSFSIFGTSGKIQGEKSKSTGLSGLINDLAKLAEKSETYQKTFDLGKKGVAHAHFSVSSRPIRGSYATKPTDRLKISKPKKEPPPTHTPMPPTAGPIKERESIVDVFEEENHVRVTAELPDVKENDIDLKVESNTLTITADTPARKYHKQVELPTPVKTGILESNYRNGVLEVKLKKAKETKKTKKDT
jgi:HSP20 family molecular chaperone IbpA